MIKECRLGILEAKMADFKFKVSIGNANIELEGDSELVKNFFNELRVNGLGKLSDFNVINTTREKTVISSDFQNIVNTDNIETNSTNQDDNYPTLNDIVLSNKIKTETNWILLYTLYATEFGKKSVAKKEISNMYKTTNRYTTARSKNFATNIKKLVTDKLISAINDNDFIITDKGKEEARKLLGI